MGSSVEEAPDHDGVAPFLELPPTWDGYLGALPAKLRHEIRRKAKKLEADAGPFSIVTAGTQDLTALLDRFVELHHLSEGPKGVFMVPGMEIFFRRLGEAFLSSGAFRLNFIEVNGSLAAGTIGFRWGDRSYLYNSAFDRSWGALAPGMVLVGEDIRLAIEDGASGFDLLKGDYPYKYRFGAVPRQVRRMIVRRERLGVRADRPQHELGDRRASPPSTRIPDSSRVSGSIRLPATRASCGARPTIVASGWDVGPGTSPAPSPQCHDALAGPGDLDPHRAARQVVAGLGERPRQHAHAEVDRQVDGPVLPAELPAGPDPVGRAHVLTVQEPFDDARLHEVGRRDVAGEPGEAHVAPPLLAHAHGVFQQRLRRRTPRVEERAGVHLGATVHRPRVPRVGGEELAVQLRPERVELFGGLAGDQLGRGGVGGGEVCHHVAVPPARRRAGLVP